MKTEIVQGKIYSLPKAVVQIKEALGEDAQLHLVGGCIRDMLLRKTPKDFDFATVLPPEIVERRCKAAGIATVIVGIRRGTISAIINHVAYEITTFRQRGKETLFSKTIEEDLSARDFTINAIAYNLHTGTFVDPHNGRLDLYNGQLISVGSARHRFEEDPHRILRMCRFAAQFDFEIRKEEMEIAIKLSMLLQKIEPERINAELKKIFVNLDGDKLLKCLMLLDEVGFFKIWIPEIEACKGIKQNKYHSLDVYEHIMNVVAGCNTYHVKLAALFHDIGKVATKTIEENGDIHFYGHEDMSAIQTANIMKRLKFSNHDIETVKQLVALHMRPIDCGKKAIRKLKALLESDENFLRWMELKYADKVSGGTPEIELEKWKVNWEAFRNLLVEIELEEEIHPTTQLAIDGFVVMNLFRLKAGPKVGVWLEKCKEYVYEFPEKNTIEDLTDLLMAIERRGGQGMS